MKLFKKTMILAGCIAALGLGAATAMAQGGGGGFGGGGGGGGFGGGGGGFGGGGGGRGGRGGFGAANLDQIRSDMEVKDDAEWNAIAAKITAVQTARMATVGGRGGRGRRGAAGAAGGAGAAPTTPLADAIAELQKAYDDNAPAPEIKAKIAKVHDERKAAQDAYTKAQDDLRALLTSRQEAYLTLNGGILN